MSERLGVAVIGAGIGAAHVEAFAALPTLFDVRFVCDLNLARAEEAVEGLSGCRAVADIQEAFADPQVDLIDICLPPQLHASMTLAALEARKHVICEKPLAGSMADVRRMADCAIRMDRQVFPVFQYRYGKGYRALHELKQHGLLGRPDVVSLETHWQRGADYYARPWRGTWAGELGGVIVSHACHAHNLATHLVGNVVEVAALLDTRVNPIETEDCAAITMRTVEGALITSSITLGAAGNGSRLRGCFEHLMVTSGTEPYQIGAGPWTFEATNPACQDEVDAVLARVPDVPLRFAGLFTDIHARLTGRPDLYLPVFEEGRHSIELITALYASARSRQLVSLPLQKNHFLANGWLSGSFE